MWYNVFVMEFGLWMVEYGYVGMVFGEKFFFWELFVCFVLGVFDFLCGG